MRKILAGVVLSAVLGLATMASAQTYYAGSPAPASTAPTVFVLDIPGQPSQSYNPNNYGAPTQCNNTPVWNPSGWWERHCWLYRRQATYYAPPPAVVLGVLAAGVYVYSQRERYEHQEHRGWRHR